MPIDAKRLEAALGAAAQSAIAFTKDYSRPELAGRPRDAHITLCVVQSDEPWDEEDTSRVWPVFPAAAGLISHHMQIQKGPREQEVIATFREVSQVLKGAPVLDHPHLRLTLELYAPYVPDVRVKILVNGLPASQKPLEIPKLARRLIRLLAPLEALVRPKGVSCWQAEDRRIFAPTGALALLQWAAFMKPGLIEELRTGQISDKLPQVSKVEHHRDLLREAGLALAA